MSTETSIKQSTCKHKFVDSKRCLKCGWLAPSYPRSRADFLWPHKKGSVEEAGYEFVNASTEEYRKIWWQILISSIRE